MKKKKIFVFSFIILFLLIIVYLLVKHYDFGGQQIPVLLYHHFLTDEELKEYDNTDEYAVSAENFERQMKYLYENNYKTITLDELNCWKKGKCNIPKKAFVVVADDGLTSVHKYAEPILKKYGYSATLFTISSRVTKKTPKWDPETYLYIGEDVLNEENKIVNIQSHTHDLHKMIDNSKAVEVTDYKEIYEDLKKSKNILDSSYLAYPFNTYNKKIFKALDKNGYKLAFRGTNKKTYKNEYKYMISRIFVNNDMERFKKIFETDDFNQSLTDKIKSDVLKIKKMVIG